MNEIVGQEGYAPIEGRLAVIGGGKMGEAIVSGLLGAGVIGASDVVIAEPDGARRDVLASLYGVEVVADGALAVRQALVTLLAVKPQVIDVVVGELADSVGSSIIVSIAAGVTCARLEAMLGVGASVVRVMPNTPAMVGAGMALVSGGVSASRQDVDRIASMFSAIGRAVVVDEALQDAGTAISGSGPAYFALVVDALARAGETHGLSRGIAQELAVQTMLGTALMLQTREMDPEELIQGVSSPGGTTVAALAELESLNVRAAFAQAVSAAVNRSKELGSRN